MNENQEMETVERLTGHAWKGLEALFGETGTGTVFSSPHTVGDEVIITAAAWERGGGFGLGAGSGPDGQGAGGGGGGGGGAQGRPVAVIRIGPGTVEVKPILDLTKIGVTVLTTLVAVWRALR